jgi:UDP-N-acetylglucosamine 2-epimerase (non-hydrolysing)
MYEVLHHYLPKIENSTILENLHLEKNKYFVVSAHREENINSDSNFFGLLKALNHIAEKYNYPVIVSTHPRTRNRIDSLKNFENDFSNQTSSISIHPLIQWQKPMGFSDYNALQMNSYAVLSDSGTISEESSILNFRALNIREAHERPEAMEEASVMMVGLNPDRILQGLLQLGKQEIGEIRNFRPVSDYSMPNVSEKVVRIVLSYTDYINRVVWRKL